MRLNCELSLWDLADPSAAAQAAIEVYGPDAATAAAHCALAAHFDGRDADYRFWCKVFAHLEGRRPAGEPGRWLHRSDLN
ncbi:hypothetical protein C7I84_05980 [Mesorhizobium ephedrae]|uniref:Uncharacterized protein n=1 Tax=Kumtagia ephedrae TaxID=2116701 RepID=A0A2P7SPV4_9HYPH|nr:hypothetical protein C7I84_05980 [Mesorhizobium ephedrae]